MTVRNTPGAPHPPLRYHQNEIMKKDPFGARETFDTGSGNAYLYRLDRLADHGFGGLDRLPFSIKVLLEAVIRECDGRAVTEQDVERLATYDPKGPAREEIPFVPARVLLQDFTGVPAVVDLAALRSAVARLGGNTDAINPRVPVHLVIDHSIQVDHFGTHEALRLNSDIEFRRNRERYAFLRWGQQAFENFSVVPPSGGICHQVNLEYIARGVWTRPEDGLQVAYPDSLVGTDSHTTMINGLGVLGWGVGGIEAEAAMLGQPICMLMPEVIGFRMTGRLPEGATATDLVLTVTRRLRAYGVVGRFVEFFGPGLDHMSIPDPRHHFQHVAGIRRDHGILPRGRDYAGLHASHGPANRRSLRWWNGTRRSRASSASRTPPIRNSSMSWSSISGRSCPASPDRNARRTLFPCRNSAKPSPLRLPPLPDPRDSAFLRTR